MAMVSAGIADTSSTVFEVTRRRPVIYIVSAIANNYDSCHMGVNLSGDFERAMLWGEIRRTYQLFLKQIAPLFAHPNPLPILMRAVNAVRARFVIRQPCWRKGRWRSTT